MFYLIACPKIISRQQWNARAPTATSTILSSQLPNVFIHHGGADQYCTTQSSCADIVRSYQNYHMGTKGWSDIAYNFVVGEDGNVYEGRGWNAVGAHTYGYNEESIGICIIGDFTGVCYTTLCVINIEI